MISKFSWLTSLRQKDCRFAESQRGGSKMKRPYLSRISKVHDLTREWRTMKCLITSSVNMNMWNMKSVVRNFRSHFLSVPFLSALIWFSDTIQQARAWEMKAVDESDLSAPDKTKRQSRRNPKYLQSQASEWVRIISFIRRRWTCIAEENEVDG